MTKHECGCGCSCEAESGSGAFTTLDKEAVAEKKEVLSQPIKMVDVEKIKGFEDLINAYSSASIQARRVGTCAKIWEQMLQDKDRPTILLGLAGPLVAAGLRKVISDMIKHNLIDVIVSTGAILYQDYYQSRGFKHYMGSPDADDKKLRDLYIDRIYDTYVDEEKFWDTDVYIGKFADELEPRNYSSREFLGKLAATVKDDQSILGNASKYGVPIFAPALNDSSIGIGLTDHFHRNLLKGKKHISIDSIQDNYELTQIVVKSPCTSAVYIAGGVPKNYINDSVVMSYVFDKDTGGHRYAIQLTTDVPHWGGLSGSTLSEATSWGKVSKKATHEMAFIEPSVSLPLLVGYLIEKNAGKNRTRMSLDWSEPILKGLSYK